MTPCIIWNVNEHRSKFCLAAWLYNAITWTSTNLPSIYDSVKTLALIKSHWKCARFQTWNSLRTINAISPPKCQPFYSGFNVLKANINNPRFFSCFKHITSVSKTEAHQEPSMPYQPASRAVTDPVCLWSALIWYLRPDHINTSAETQGIGS